MSFYTSLSGLKGAQTDLSVIANNVANVGTVGFKRSRTEFGDLVSSSPMQSGNVAGQGTRLKSITQQFGQGGFSASDRALDLAISGQGFFATRSDGAGGRLSYTRNGSFGLDDQRNVVDARGNFLQVLPVDSYGVVTATGITASRNLQVPLTSGQSQATSNIDVTVNLPSDAQLPANRAVYNSGNPYEFDRFDPNSYNFSSATSVYDAAGNELPATVYYTRTSAPAAADPNDPNSVPTTDSTWQARMFVGSTEVTGTTPIAMTFDGNGNLTAPTTATTLPNVQPTGASGPLSLTIDFGTATRQAAGAFSLGNFTQDGFAAGQFDNISVGPDGLVTATYSNGDSQPLGKVMMVNFANPAGLRQLGDASWSATGNSGEPLVGEASSAGFGVLQSGALEQANVDITEELVALISAQRNFQANAKAIETANTLTQTIVNMRS